MIPHLPSEKEQTLPMAHEALTLWSLLPQSLSLSQPPVSFSGFFSLSSSLFILLTSFPLSFHFCSFSPPFSPSLFFHLSLPIAPSFILSHSLSLSPLLSLSPSPYVLILSYSLPLSSLPHNFNSQYMSLHASHSESLPVLLPMSRKPFTSPVTSLSPFTLDWLTHLYTDSHLGL